MTRPVSLVLALSLACGSRCGGESRLELLVRYSRDVSLTGAQLTRLEALRQRRDAQNEPLFTRLDSLVGTHSPRTASEDRWRITPEEMAVRRAVLDSVRRNDEAADREALTLLTPGQAAAVRILLTRAPACARTPNARDAAPSPGPAPARD
jgi:hypothetical protein